MRSVASIMTIDDNDRALGSFYDASAEHVRRT
jgi:hypothetical protein